MTVSEDGKGERHVACMARTQHNSINLHRRVEARILYPALGCPEVIGPPVEINRMNGTSSIHLLLLANKADLKPRDVAWHLRFAKLSEPLPRHLPPNPGLKDKGQGQPTACSFSESEIEVKPVPKGPADAPRRPAPRRATEHVRGRARAAGV